MCFGQFLPIAMPSQSDQEIQQLKVSTAEKYTNVIGTYLANSGFDLAQNSTI